MKSILFGMLLGLPYFLLIGHGLVSAHVALTFPPARKYDLDFLDTLRTGKPCGMHKGRVRTTIPSNQNVTITWKLGYPHSGGFKLELLDKNERPIGYLTPSGKGGRGEFMGTDDQTIQKYSLKVPTFSNSPDLRCSGCTIRLVRQALEWGKNFLFQSCADVDIVDISEYNNDCFGHGSLQKDNSCICEKTYHGHQCQYKTDCEDAEDCSGHGQCITFEGAVIPQKECYCEPGFFGQYCEKHSPLKVKAVDITKYKEIKLKGEVKFLWRILTDDNVNEVEGVLIAHTSSYLGIGWRPTGITKNCRRFPTDAQPPTSTVMNSNLHPMDCQDIVIAKVKGDGSNIGDYYTRDRSTPRRDSFYGGKDHLTAAVGWEIDGTTTFMFRKLILPSNSSEFQDHRFDGKLTLIWAHGQENLPFYLEDDLKFHGSNSGSYILETRPISSRQRVNHYLIAAMALLGFIFVIQLIDNIIHRKVEAELHVAAAGRCEWKMKDMNHYVIPK